MDASGPERDIAYRRIHGLESQSRMPGSGHGDHPSPCCAWIVRLCRCFSGDSDDSQETTPRSRALENHLYQYEAPAVHSSPGPGQQQRTVTAYEDDADAGPLLPKTAESSAPLPRPGHSRNNSSASATAAAAAVASGAAGSATAAGTGGAESLGAGGGKRSLGGGGGGQEGCGVAGPGPGSVAPVYGVSRGGHHRSSSYGDAAGRPRKSKAEDANVTAAEALNTAAAVAGGGVAVDGGGGAGLPAPSTAAGRPGAVFGPMQDEDDDFCPTCLDAYTDENPKIFTECGHHFHMPCIYAWLERKDTCPMCESPMQAPGM